MARGRFGTHNRMPVNTLRLTFTGSDMGPGKIYDSRSSGILVATYQVGKETHVPKIHDGADGFEFQQVMVLGDYLVLTPDDVLGVSEPGEYLDVLAQIQAEAARRDDAEERAKPTRTSVTEDIGPEGVSD